MQLIRDEGTNWKRARTTLFTCSVLHGAARFSICGLAVYVCVLLCHIQHCFHAYSERLFVLVLLNNDVVIITKKWIYFWLCWFKITENSGSALSLTEQNLCVFSTSSRGAFPRSISNNFARTSNPTKGPFVLCCEYGKRFTGAQFWTPVLSCTKFLNTNVFCGVVYHTISKEQCSCVTHTITLNVCLQHTKLSATHSLAASKCKRILCVILSE